MADGFNNPGTPWQHQLPPGQHHQQPPLGQPPMRMFNPTQFNTNTLPTNTYHTPWNNPNNVQTQQNWESQWNWGNGGNTGNTGTSVSENAALSNQQAVILDQPAIDAKHQWQPAQQHLDKHQPPHQTEFIQQHSAPPLQNIHPQYNSSNAGVSLPVHNQPQPGGLTNSMVNGSADDGFQSVSLQPVSPQMLSKDIHFVAPSNQSDSFHWGAQNNIGSSNPHAHASQFQNDTTIQSHDDSPMSAFFGGGGQVIPTQSQQFEPQPYTQQQFAPMTSHTEMPPQPNLQQTQNMANTMDNSPVLNASNSFSNLAHQPSPFDEIGCSTTESDTQAVESGHDMSRTSVDSGGSYQASVGMGSVGVGDIHAASTIAAHDPGEVNTGSNLGIPLLREKIMNHHSRDSSLGGSVQFVIGSNASSASESASESPIINQGEQAGQSSFQQNPLDLNSSHSDSINSRDAHSDYIHENKEHALQQQGQTLTEENYASQPQSSYESQQQQIPYSGAQYERSASVTSNTSGISGGKDLNRPPSVQSSASSEVAGYTQQSMQPIITNQLHQQPPIYEQQQMPYAGHNAQSPLTSTPTKHSSILESPESMSKIPGMEVSRDGAVLPTNSPQSMINASTLGKAAPPTSSMNMIGTGESGITLPPPTINSGGPPPLSSSASSVSGSTNPFSRRSHPHPPTMYTPPPASGFGGQSTGTGIAAKSTLTPLTQPSPQSPVLQAHTEAGAAVSGTVNIPPQQLNHAAYNTTAHLPGSLNEGLVTTPAGAQPSSAVAEILNTSKNSQVNIYASPIETHQPSPFQPPVSNEAQRDGHMINVIGHPNSINDSNIDHSNIKSMSVQSAMPGQADNVSSGMPFAATNRNGPGEQIDAANPGIVQHIQSGLNNLPQHFTPTQQPHNDPYSVQNQVVHPNSNSSNVNENPVGDSGYFQAPVNIAHSKSGATQIDFNPSAKPTNSMFLTSQTQAPAISQAVNIHSSFEHSISNSQSAITSQGVFNVSGQSQTSSVGSGNEHGNIFNPGQINQSKEINLGSSASDNPTLNEPIVSSSAFSAPNQVEVASQMQHSLYNAQSSVEELSAINSNVSTQSTVSGHVYSQTEINDNMQGHGVYNVHSNVESHFTGVVSSTTSPAHQANELNVAQTNPFPHSTVSGQPNKQNVPSVQSDSVFSPAVQPQQNLHTNSVYTPNQNVDVAQQNMRDQAFTTTVVNPSDQEQIQPSGTNSSLPSDAVQNLLQQQHKREDSQSSLQELSAINSNTANSNQSVLGSETQIIGNQGKKIDVRSHEHSHNVDSRPPDGHHHPPSHDSHVYKSPIHHGESHESHHQKSHSGHGESHESPHHKSHVGHGGSHENHHQLHVGHGESHESHHNTHVDHVESHENPHHKSHVGHGESHDSHHHEAQSSYDAHQRGYEQEQRQDYKADRRSRYQNYHDRNSDYSYDRYRNSSRDRSRDLSRDSTRDLSRDRTRELSRDRTRDISRDRTRELSGDRTRELSRDRTRELSRDRSRDLSRDRGRDYDYSKHYYSKGYNRHDSQSNDPYYNRQFDPRHDPYRDPYYDQRYNPQSRYDVDHYGRPRSRHGYPDDRTGHHSYGYSSGDPQTAGERSRSRQGYPEDTTVRSSSRQGYPERPSSRQDILIDPQRSSSRQGVRDDGRPLSRQGDVPERPSSRQGQPEYRQDSYRGQYDYYGQQHQGYDNQYRDYYGRPYDRGYQQELRSYQHQSGYPQQQYDYSKIGYYDQYNQWHYYSRSQSYDNGYDYDRRSYHSRGSTPGFERNSADHFAQEFNNSRPSSRQSGYLGYDQHEESPILRPGDATGHGNYMDSYQESYLGQPQVPEAPPVRKTPPRYPLPHVKGSFTSGGLLVEVYANRPQDGQPARVAIHEQLEGITSDEAEELKTFPGPLVKGETTKSEVLTFCQNKIQELRNIVGMIDRESAELMWKYLELLVKLNGTVVGTDIADMLMMGHESSTQNIPLSGSTAPMDATFASATGVAPGETSGIGDNAGEMQYNISADRSIVSQPSPSDVALNRFRQLCLFGRKKEALEFAMKSSLWEQALFLAMRMGPRISASVTTRFMNSALSVGDPLRTMYQMLSGRQPAACTMVGDERFGDWRPHLAIILSQATEKSELDTKSIIAMGDTFATKGYLYASQFCYLMAGCPFNEASKKTAKLVLLGSNHTLPLQEHAMNIYIQTTEVYEYAMSLGNPKFCIRTFQAYKYLYATRLVDEGMPEEALRYCETIGATILESPSSYSKTLVQNVADLGDHLKMHDPERKMSYEDVPDPAWLTNLQYVKHQYESGLLQFAPPPSSGSQTPATGMGTPATGGGGTRASSEVGEVIMGGVQQQNIMQQAGLETTTGLQQQMQQMSLTDNNLSQHQHYDPNQQVHQMQYNTATDTTTQQQMYNPNQPQQEPNQDLQPSTDPAQNQNYQQPQYVYDPATQQYVYYDPSQHQMAQQGVDNTTAGLATDNYSHQQQGTDSAHQLNNATHQWSENHQNQTNEYANNFMGQQHTGHDLYQPQIAQQTNPLQNKGLHAIEEPITPAGSETNQSSFDFYGQVAQNTQPESSAQDPSAALGTSAVNRSRQASVSTDELHQGASTANGGDQPKKQYWPGEDDDENDKLMAAAKKADPKKVEKGKEGGRSGLFGWLGFKGKGKDRPNEMKLPDDKKPTIVWDKDKNQWVDTNSDGTEVIKTSTAPPPTDTEYNRKMSMPGGPPIYPPPPGQGGMMAPPGEEPITSSNANGAPPGLTPNKFSRPKLRGARTQYVDVLADKSKPAETAPSNLFHVLPKSQSVPANIFIPSVAESAIDHHHHSSHQHSVDGGHSNEQQQQQHADDQYNKTTENPTQQQENDTNNLTKPEKKQDTRTTEPPGHSDRAADYTQQHQQQHYYQQQQHEQPPQYNQSQNTNQHEGRAPPMQTGQSNYNNPEQQHHQQRHHAWSAVGQQPSHAAAVSQYYPQEQQPAAYSNEHMPANIHEHSNQSEQTQPATGVPPPPMGMQFYNPSNYQQPSSQATGVPRLNKMGNRRPQYPKS